MKNVLIVMVTLLAASSAYGQFVWTSGFETGDFSEWDGTATTAYPPTVVTALPGLAPRSGSYMAQLGPDYYNQVGSSITKTLNISTENDEVIGYMGLSNDSGAYPGSSNAIQIRPIGGGINEGILLKGDGTVHTNHDWQVDVYGAPAIPALVPGEWLKVRALQHALGMWLFAEGPGGESHLHRNPYTGAGLIPNIGTVTLTNGRGLAGNIDGGFDDFTATPEPMTLTLLGLGAIGLLRRKRA